MCPPQRTSFYFLTGHIVLLRRSLLHWTGRDLVNPRMTDIEAARYLFAAPARYDTRHSRPGLRSRLPAVPRGYSAVPASAASPARKRAEPGGRRSLLRSVSAAGQPPKPTSNSINPSVCSAHNATCSTPTARGRSKSSGDVDGLEIAAMGRPGIGDGSRHGAIETGGGRTVRATARGSAKWRPGFKRVTARTFWPRRSTRTSR